MPELQDSERRKAHFPQVNFGFNAEISEENKRSMYQDTAISF
ncbi:MAG: hypothetical protein Q7K57_32490 [Burkholderiaceae bacterium]|nr:hypothetical protein [Burkholderiaceae bacterium]